VRAARHDGAAGGPAAGFSLVEMLVVLAVLALAVGLGGPTLGRLLPGQRLDAAAEAVAAEVALLRAEAVRTGQTARLLYDPATSAFLSSRRGARPLAMAPLRVDIDIPPEARSGPGEIRFLPSGATTGGRIVLAGATGIRVMTVSRVTGALRRGDAVP
jgi:general secretion pathway protein H